MAVSSSVTFSAGWASSWPEYSPKALSLFKHSTPASSSGSIRSMRALPASRQPTASAACNSSRNSPAKPARAPKSEVASSRRVAAAL
eukprot:2280583-Pyramimonas_sp.AAC.1